MDESGATLEPQSLPFFWSARIAIRTGEKASDYNIYRQEGYAKTQEEAEIAQVQAYRFMKEKFGGDKLE